MISAEAAAKALCELFLANADRGDNAANDHLIAEMVGRIRAQQESRDGDRCQQPVGAENLGSVMRPADIR